MPTEAATLMRMQAARRIARPTAWKLALLAGFVTQLMLIVFVTAIGLQQLEVTTRNLQQVVDVHMRKQNYIKRMVVAARERTVILLILPQIRDPFERDAMLMKFNEQGADFVAARLALLGMPLSDTEAALISRQGQVTGAAQPVQLRVIDLINADFIDEATNLVLNQAIPMQNEVMSTLSQLEAETQAISTAASEKARKEHAAARFWMYLLSGAALLVGLLVAAVVFYFAARISREREQLVSLDTLTGLPNRMLFMDRLNQSLIRAKRYNTQIGLMFIDLDRFKRVNDTLGHASGDQLIREVARRLRDTVRADDIVARLGGDEFVVAISDVVTLSSILQVVEKMLATVTVPYQLDGREIFCSCSIGISIYPHDGTSASNLLKNADTAMYHAKNSGRNRFQLYDAAMNAMAEERLQLETELHYALERNEFVFHYQPQLNLKTGRIHAVEALIRWQHPKKGLLSPANFLDMLDETGDIVSVGRTLLLVACRQTAIWHAAGFTDLGVAVNVSGKEFWHSGLIDSIRNALTQSGLPPSALQIELTEGIFMDDVEAAEGKVQALKALGISVAVDDFGTGYSSLAHLKRFPLDVLKIDRYFVKDVHHAPASEALVSSILALCRGLNLGIVAEGIENREQLESLRKLGCQVVQGYFISRPVPADAIHALLGKNWLQALGPAEHVQPNRTAI
ncbi:MAG: EAL domain-containing protein [Thiobacillus sp.]|uniref:putative bifunctional diguanylate cyclase/phosphodiesterase n=1 Tax=Thiobacillus sp. TaxID=924 RepID=UPI002732C156|nr:EAL domain-containing protein [Thiobacillus sp.]MDP3584557.1 EAL domain-containing protein [Thiobacillus sp.]